MFIIDEEDQADLGLFIKFPLDLKKTVPASSLSIYSSLMSHHHTRLKLFIISVFEGRPWWPLVCQFSGLLVMLEAITVCEFCEIPSLSINVPVEIE